MKAMSGPALPARIEFRPLAKHRGLAAIVATFVLAVALVNFVSPSRLSYADFHSLADVGAPLALASIGQTITVLAGGLDLSAGATISLVNVTVASLPQASPGAQTAVVAAGLALGCVIGAFNGFFVAFLRLQPIVVTLSTMFLVHGITLVIMQDPGGTVGPALTSLLAGTAIPNVLPSSIVLVLSALLFWRCLRGMRFGVAIYAVGSDADAARSAGLSVRWTRFWTFVLGGLFYGVAGVFISAQTGSADPLVGDPLLLQTFTAVVLGGTSLAGGRGSVLGSVLGAYTLMIMVNVLLVLNVPAYYSTLAEGVILLAAAMTNGLGEQSPVRQYIRYRVLKFGARSGMAARDVPPSAAAGFGTLAAKGRVAIATVPWRVRNGELLRFILPAYTAFVMVLLVTQVVYGGSAIFAWKYYDSLIVLASFLVILALGQGTVILSGGLDLSIPWTICFCAILATGFIKGSDLSSLWVVPLVLVIGASIGFFNGVGVAILGLSPIVVTLAMNGVLQGAALVFSNGTPGGYTSPGLHWLMTGKLLSVTPVVFFVLLFIVFVLGALNRTVFNRWVYALGNSQRASDLSGVDVRRTTTAVYALSGFCSALVGVLLTGFSGQASLGMGDTYLLPSIAVVVVGGTLITGGRGHYLGVIGGVLLLTALQMLLAGTTLPSSFRDIAFGCVMLAAVVALRE
jgi:ribose transport system permease protein